jgi:uncharacterized protein YjiS (DUF1127 family)
MSTILADTAPLGLAPSSGQEGRLPQNHSWQALTVSWRMIQLWTARRSQRVALRELTEDRHLLADIGVTRAWARSESAKPFWRR